MHISHFFFRFPVPKVFIALFLSFFSALLLSLPFAFHTLSSCRKKFGVNYGQNLEMGPWSIRDSADSPDKFWSAIKKPLYPTKLPSEQGSAFQINGTKTTDNKFIAESFCDYFTDVAIKLKKKSFLLRNLVWSIPSGMKLPQIKEEFLFRAVKVEEILTELKNLKRKKATGLDSPSWIT